MLEPIPVLSEVIYLHPSMFMAYDYHIRKGVIISIDGDNYRIDPSKSNFYGHKVTVPRDLIWPSQELIRQLRDDGHVIEDMEQSIRKKRLA